MTYAIDTLTRDVMARLGELPRPQTSYPDDIPWPQDVIAMKVRSLLPEIGRRLILETQQPNDPTTQQPTNPTTQQPTIRQMPCGLYAAEVALPEDFLRLGCVKMGEWRHAVSEVTDPNDPAWGRQWSAEPGIAGCPERPRVYLDRDAEGAFLRLAGSRSEEDELEFLTIWRVPVPDAEGRFGFPASLYGALTSVIASSLAALPT